jgi:hypothetical protein
MKEPTIQNLLIDSVITIILAIFQFYGFLLIMIFSFGFFICGNGYLHVWENIRNGFILSIIILIIQVLITLKTFKLRTVIIRISLWVITVSTLIPVFILGTETFKYSHYYEEFDSEKWQAEDEKPLSMIRQFCDDQSLMGKTREEISALLGEGTDYWAIDENEMAYRTEGYLSPLVFTFKNDTVVKYELQCYD